jgi:predicted DNA-binding transcriptional regulator AlpA
MSRQIKIMPDGLPEHGYVRAKDVIEAYSLSRSQFWVLINERQVASAKISARVTVFLAQDIRRAFLGGGADAAA